MRSPRKSHDTAHPLRRRRIAAVLLTAALVSSNLTGVAQAGGSDSDTERGHGSDSDTQGGRHRPDPAADPSVITFWNQVAVTTIVIEGGKANAEALLWYSFAQAAVYNAVVGITREYELYRWHRRGPKGASPQAAAAAAAHLVLLTYFPASEATLTAALAQSLALIPEGWAKEKGIRYGERAALRIIKLREDDGRFADVPFEMPLAPGVWQPTPPGLMPFFDPWLSQVDPLLLKKPSQFRPGPPPALTSAAYTADFIEVRDYGVAGDGSARSPLQTETALFFSDIGIGPIQAALRDLVTRRQMDISDSARLFAAVDLSLADAIIVSWDSKFHYGFWRPVTAIQLAEGDGNPDTNFVAGWLPKVITPPYPDYTSGLTTIVGALSGVLSGLLGDGRVDLYISSAAAGVPPVPGPPPVPGVPLVRYYEFAADLNQDAIDARVWSGIHFRTADVVGNEMGLQVADWALDHYFQPTRGHGH